MRVPAIALAAALPLASLPTAAAAHVHHRAHHPPLRVHHGVIAYG